MSRGCLEVTLIHRTASSCSLLDIFVNLKMFVTLGVVIIFDLYHIGFEFDGLLIAVIQSRCEFTALELGKTNLGIGCQSIASSLAVRL